MNPQSTTSLRAKTIQQGDFLLLLALFVFFRLCSVFSFRPGGYTRDYSDLIFYQGRASWQDFALLPYRDFWSEYPPLFAWFSLWIDTLSSRIPLWEDARLWYAAVFGIATVLAETVTFLCLYRLARLLYADGALRTAWIYAGLFLPVYFLGGWYDALPVATIFVGLTLLLEWPTLLGALGVGIALGIGGLLKLVPLALLALLPLTRLRWSARLVAAGVALLIVAAGYGWAYLHGPVMTLASIRSLLERTGWSTLYAWVNGYTRLGKVLGDVFDPAARIGQYDSIYPEWLVLAGWLLVGAGLLVAVWRQPALRSHRTLITFAALTYTILLLSYPAWNPQYALYLLPFLALLWPNRRGVLYALALMFLTLIEHPVYHNLIGPDYAPVSRALIEVNYRALFLAIIIARTALLLALVVDLSLALLARGERWRWLPVAVSVAAVAAVVALIPQFGRAYVAGRLATSTVRPLALYLNAQPDEPMVVVQQLQLERQLRPFLDQPERLQLFGGRPGRIEPLPATVGNQPFLYLHTNADDADLAARVEQEYACAQHHTLNDWQLWYCQGAPAPRVAVFEQGIELTALHLPAKLSDPLRLTLFWQTSQPITQSYTVFVHVVDSNGLMLGQWDQQPGGGATPTTSWQPGSMVVDDYQTPLDLSNVALPVRLWVGLYEPQSGVRLNPSETVLPVSDARLELHVYE